MSFICERDRQANSYTIRYVTESDVSAYRRILDDTSARDRYYRFFHHVNFFNDAQLRRQVEPRADVIGLIAEDGSDPLGLAQAFAAADGSAEFAVIVADRARRRGVAATLFAGIIAASQARGITRLVALSLAENRAFARLATTFGMEAEPKDEDGIVAWTLDLTTRPVERNAPAAIQPLPSAA